MILSTIALTAGVFGLVFCVGYLLMSLFDPYSTQLDDRLRQMSDKATTAPKSVPGNPSTLAHQPLRGFAKKLIGRLVPDSDGDRRQHQTRLLNAGIYSPTALSFYFAGKLALMVSPLLLGILGGWLKLFDARLGLLAGCVGGGLGMVLPPLWLERRIRHRHVVLRRSLADFLDLMIVCLQSGLSLQGTIQRVSEELRIAHPILAAEMNVVQRDIDLGVTVDTALRRFADRCGYEGIRTLSTFVREAQRVGTELADALRVHADMLRTQRELAAEELAQTAAVKILFPTLLLILPATFVVLAGPAAIQIQEAFAKMPLE